MLTRDRASPPTGSVQPNLYLEVGLLVVLSLLWGNSFALIKVALGSLPPLTITALRVVLASVLLIAFMRCRGLSLPRDPAVWGAFFVQGLLQSALPFTFIGWGEQHIDSGLAGVLNATTPMIVVLIALATGHGRARITRRKIAGVALGLGGVVATIGIGSLRSLETAAPLAQAAILAASFCYALAPMWGQRFVGLPPVVVAAGAMIAASLLMVPPALLVDRPWTLAPTWEATASVLVLGTLCTAVAMMIYFRLIHTLGPLGTTSGGYLRAGIAVASGVLVLGEIFTASAVVGMVLIVVGVVAITLPSGRDRLQARQQT
ncbi:DMT family transporter [Aureimonas ureilytica]|uniref:DMT family transporter n=1 Tax=Aureimonas ureilytica TaxID=401562 RepID=UPI000367B060|nr:EamA family transporter [Aureimonas ureilytica]